MSGLTSTGFTSKTTEELLAEIEADERAEIDAAIDVSAETPLGNLNGIFAAKLAELWELAAVAYKGFKPTDAEDTALDALCELTGTRRLRATKSTVDCTMGLDADTTIAAGSVCHVAGQPTIRFVLTDDVVSTTAGSYTGKFESENYGPVVANAGTLTVIPTPVTGWNSVTNPLDAVLGDEAEEDTALRIRREEELSAAGACTLDSLRAQILEVEGVRQAFVFENNSLYPNSDGLPGKSFEVVLFDGLDVDASDADIADAIWKNKPSGIKAHGTTPISVEDSFGNSHTVKFTRANIKEVYFEVDVTTTDEFPEDGEDQIKAAMVALGESLLTLGQDVIALRFRAAPLSVKGVEDVTAIRLGFTSSPVGTANLTIDPRDVADVDTSRILVTIT